MVSARALESGLAAPLLSTASTVTTYCVAPVRPAKVQEGMGLVQVALPAPLPMASAVKVYEAQGPPVEGGVAEATAEVGPVGTRVKRVGAVSAGWARAAGAEGGRVVPSARVAVAVRVYVTPWERPARWQAVGSVQVEVSVVVLPMGVAERV